MPSGGGVDGASAIVRLSKLPDSLTSASSCVFDRVILVSPRPVLDTLRSSGPFAGLEWLRVGLCTSSRLRLRGLGEEAATPAKGEVACDCGRLSIRSIFPTLRGLPGRKVGVGSVRRWPTVAVRSSELARTVQVLVGQHSVARNAQRERRA